MKRDRPPGEPELPAGPAQDGEAAPSTRRPVFHVFEEFYRRAIRAETPPAHPAGRTP